LVMADAARALGRTRQHGALEALKAVVDQHSWADVVRAGALDGMAALRDETALDTVVKRTRYGVPTRGRRAAVHALATLGEGRKTRELLEELLEDQDPHFKIDVVSALTTLGDTKSRGAMRRALERELDGRVSRRLREALRDLGDAAGADKKRVNDELESVRDELLELKNRLSKLEAKKGARTEREVAKAAPTKPEKTKAAAKKAAPPPRPARKPLKSSTPKPSKPKAKAHKKAKR
jgi:aminopeptidase N